MTVIQNKITHQSLAASQWRPTSPDRRCQTKSCFRITATS